MSIGYNDLIVTTANQCYIFNFANWNTPNIFDLKDSVSFILQSPKYFCLVESTNGLMIYNYDGKMVSNPKIAGAKCKSYIILSLIHEQEKNFHLTWYHSRHRNHKQ